MQNGFSLKNNGKKSFLELSSFRLDLKTQSSVNLIIYLKFYNVLKSPLFFKNHLQYVSELTQTRTGTEQAQNEQGTGTGT